MNDVVFKTLNASFIAGIFFYFMVHETYPFLVLQSLTYQVVKRRNTSILSYRFYLQGLVLLALYSILALLACFLPVFKGNRKKF